MRHSALLQQKRIRPLEASAEKSRKMTVICKDIHAYLPVLRRFPGTSLTSLQLTLSPNM